MKNVGTKRVNCMTTNDPQKAVNEAINAMTSSSFEASDHISSSFRSFSNSSQVSVSSSSRKVQSTLFGEKLTDSPNTKSNKPIKEDTTPTHHEIDYESLKTYIYPINYEIRDYQFNIIEKSFYHNMLVALPTGLGKTFIAATMILNYWRWFPKAKIIFMAPTRPLVAQQIKACFSIIGLKHQFAILLDKLKRNRLEIWSESNIFFTTPQVVENDLHNGLVDPKTISLLIIDEAHKAKGNYAYNNVVKFINRFNTSYRILALTATPSATVEGVKEIVSNLNISKIAIRTENSIDIIKYFKHKRIDKIDVDFSEYDDINQYLMYLSNASESFLKVGNERHLIEFSDPLKLNLFRLLELSKRNLANPNLNEGLKWSNHFLIKMLMFIATCFKKLKIYGLANFSRYFMEQKTKNLKSKNKIVTNFYKDDNIIKLEQLIEKNNHNGDIKSHPKIQTLVEYVTNFFTTTPYEDSKVIVFTEFRDSALEIVKSMETVDGLSPHIFIGQASESLDKADKDSVQSSSEIAKLKGMNQKVQKQLIRDFKANKLNILVATSIGEEGLDIGEVDLIVCYDSTSSPIKNIQRLGRTGRKRDGNILLLFSDNERAKFEKAMDNYEWIQNYIMKHEGELTADSIRNRILPKGVKPILEKKFIETVNHMEDEDDNDKIIKIAMSYMKGNGKQNKPKVPKKIEKKFFMPDNVNTGFQNVSKMLKSINNAKLSRDSSPELIDVDSLSFNISETPRPYDLETSEPKRQKVEISSIENPNVLPKEKDELDEFDEFDMYEPPLIQPMRSPNTVEISLQLSPIKLSPNNPHLATNKFEPNDGFLTPQEKIHLFTNYYNPLPPGKQSLSPDFNNPSTKFTSSRTLRLSALLSTNPDTAKSNYTELKSHADSSNESKQKCLQYLHQNF